MALAHHQTARWTARVTNPLSIAPMVIGMPVAEAAALLPRVFNLCRAAQSLAAQMAFGLPVSKSAPADLAADILRDHVLKICFLWPQHLGIAPLKLPADWQDQPLALRDALFGAGREVPKTQDEFRRFLDNKHGVGLVLSAIERAYAKGEASTPKLPLVSKRSVFDMSAQENSAAARHAATPLMQSLEADFGRGPLWRAVGLVLDLQSCLEGTLPKPFSPHQGAAVVPAARGFYGLCADVKDGKLRTFRRTTPTDHLLARGGMLDQALLHTDRSKHDPLFRLLIDILDPCLPLTFEEAAHA